VVLCVVLLLLHYGVIWFYHGLNSIVAMLLFTIVLLHTSLILALVLWLFDWFFCLKAYAENWFCVPCHPAGILTLYMYKFCFA